MEGSRHNDSNKVSASAGMFLNGVHFRLQEREDADIRRGGGFHGRLHPLTRDSSTYVRGYFPARDASRSPPGFLVSFLLLSPVGQWIFKNFFGIYLIIVVMLTLRAVSLAHDLPFCRN